MLIIYTAGVGNRNMNNTDNTVMQKCNSALIGCNIVFTATICLGNAVKKQFLSISSSYLYVIAVLFEITTRKAHNRT